MGNYKRLLSYLYSYENGRKANNTGYVKVDSRDNTCKITIHMQSVVQEKNEIFKAYAFTRKEGKTIAAPIGTMDLKAGTGALKIETKSNNIVDSEIPIHELSGILVIPKDLEDTQWRPRRTFASEWDDIPVSFDASLVIQEKNLPKKKDKTEQAEDKSKPDQNESAKIGDKAEAPTVEIPTVVNEIKAVGKKTSENELDCLSEMGEAKGQKEIEDADSQDMITDQTDLFMEEEASYTPERLQDEAKKVKQSLQEKLREKMKIDEVNQAKPIEAVEAARELLDNEESEELEAIHIKMFNEYPKMSPFERQDIIDCIRIEPRDIALLPISNWTLMNNYFLLNGFYQFKHLVLAKKKNDNHPKGYHYILGIPGIFYNRERNLAKAHGFREFICVKNVPISQGEFGYWSTTITLQ